MPIKERDSRGRVLAVRAARMKDGVCAVCGKTFRFDPVERSGKICSRKCNGARVGRDVAKRIKRPPEVKNCAKCGKEFCTYHRHHRHCSRACSDKNREGFVGGRKDRNHDLIARCFEGRGFLVYDAHLLGGGYPDLVVQKGGRTYLVEIKNPKWRKQYGLTRLQKKFHRKFLVHVVMTEEDVESMVRSLP